MADVNRESLEAQLELMFEELSRCQDDEKKDTIVKRIETFYKLHQSDLEHDSLVKEQEETKSRFNKTLEMIKTVGPYVATPLIMIIGLFYESKGTLPLSKWFAEARQRVFPRN